MQRIGFCPLLIQKLTQEFLSCRIALVLGSFKEHLHDISTQTVKSDSVTETLSRVASKFEKINISFDQSFDYNNASSVQADFDVNDTIEGTNEGTYQFEEEEDEDNSEPGEYQ